MGAAGATLGATKPFRYRTKGGNINSKLFVYLYLLPGDAVIRVVHETGARDGPRLVVLGGQQKADGAEQLEPVLGHALATRKELVEVLQRKSERLCKKNQGTEMSTGGRKIGNRDVFIGRRHLQSFVFDTIFTLRYE